jgi:hypothetical protein
LAIRDRRRIERRVTASSGQYGEADFVPTGLWIDPQNSRDPRKGSRLKNEGSDPVVPEQFAARS